MTHVLCYECDTIINTREHPEAWDEREEKWYCDNHLIDHEKDDELSGDGVYAR